MSQDQKIVNKPKGAYREVKFEDHRRRTRCFSLIDTKNDRVIRVDLDRQIVVECVQNRYIDIYDFDEYLDELEVVDDKGQEFIIDTLAKKIWEKVGL